LTIPEMIYVLDKERDCIQRREAGECDKDCKNCDSHIDTSFLLDGLERIVNLVYNVGKSRTRKEY
jgi:hypothetical protein